MMDVSVHDECSVSGALCFVLLLSRVFGLAPLKFKRARDGWRIRISPAASLYGKAAVCLICLMMLVSFIFDFNMEQHSSTYFKTSSDTAAWIARAIFVISPLVAVTFFGIRRMQCVITSLALLHKIKDKLNQYGTVLPFKTKIMFISMLSFCGLCLIPCARGSLVLYYLKLSNESLLVEVLYVPFYIAVVMNKMLLLQITLILTAVPAPLHQVNNCLRNLLQPICNEDPIMKCQKMMPTSSVRNLRIIHESLCSIIKDFDESHGVLLVAFIPLFLSSLVFTLYQVITHLFGGVINIYVLLIQITRIIVHTTNMIMIIEPCHLTYKQIEYTKHLIGQLLLFTPSAHKEVIYELDLFYKHLMKDVVYTPMGIFRLNRTVIVTIVASITTYLVVIIEL